jgi:hypothetical protein
VEPDRARELLRRRVEACSDELSDSTMRMLDRLVALRDSVDRIETRPAVDAALDAFVAACRKVAYDHSFDAWPGPRPQPLPVAAHDHAAVDAVIDDLDSLQRRLEKHAEFQEWVDATNNAMAYRAAATYVQHARVVLT